MNLHIGTHSLLDDPSLAFQLDRWLAYGGDSTLADVLSVVDRLRTLDGWRTAFLELHERALAVGRLLDAALHVRAAQFFLRPDDSRAPLLRRTFISLMRDVYGVAESTVVPYLRSALPVYRLTSPEHRDTLVVFGGFDSYIEEFFPILLAIRDLGFNVVAFEGPGQGGALEDGGLPMTPDWHRPVGAVLDALELDDVIHSSACR